MDLMLRVGIVVVILIVLAGIAFLFVNHSPSAPLTQQQATDLVLNDLNISNPHATINVVNVSPSKLTTNSWNIVVTVAYNTTRPCPTLSIEGFDYPATGFVPSTYNIYTRGCVIYGLSTAPSYVISSPLIAIARSYNASPEVLVKYVNTYGYNNTNVNAEFFPTLNGTQTPLNISYNNIWLLNYSATNAAYNEYEIMNVAGQIQGNYTLQK